LESPASASSANSVVAPLVTLTSSMKAPSLTIVQSDMYQKRRRMLLPANCERVNVSVA
jgi:hypothetical protein